jgi:hypothetical protein
MTGAPEVMSKAGFKVRHWTGEDADAAAWQRGLIGGLSTDVVVMNTKGNDDYFDLSDGRGFACDVPILNHPVALHLIHSWSLKAPADLTTVGGRWLEHGAYAMVGSCHEPLLQGFVPPSSLVNRWISFVPFLVAARWWDGEPGICKPWRIVTIGDPLMLCAPPGSPPQGAAKKRIATHAEYGVDLAEHVKTLMRQTETDKSGESLDQAIRILVMLNEDDVAIGLWRLAEQRGQGGVAAKAALGPLFRSRDVDGFLSAWEKLPTRDAQELDMLWHLLLPRLGPGTAGADQNLLIQLQSAIRQPTPEIDLERLVPHLARVFGQAHARGVIEREIARATSAHSKQALMEMLKRF